MGTVSENYWYGAEVAYEQLSGDAVVVWNDNSQAVGDKLRYAVWDGSSWSTPQSIGGYAGAEPQNLRLAFDPGSDTLVLVVERHRRRRLCADLGRIGLGQRRDAGYLGHGRERPIGHRRRVPGADRRCDGRLRHQWQLGRLLPHLGRRQLECTGQRAGRRRRHRRCCVAIHGIRLQLRSHRAGDNDRCRRGLAERLGRHRLGVAGAGRDRHDRHGLSEPGRSLREFDWRGAGDLWRERPDSIVKYRTWDAVGGWSAEQIGPDYRRSAEQHDAGRRSDQRPHHAIGAGCQQRPALRAVEWQFMGGGQRPVDQYRRGEEPAVRVHLRSGRYPGRA